MISYQIYKVLHLTSICMIILAIGGLAALVLAGQGKSHPLYKKIAITHGIGMLFALVAGFGLLARLGMAHNAGLPGWVILKIGIWICFGGVTALLIRKPKLGMPVWLSVIFLTAAGAYLANYKPF